mgnify:CR=1 FL=1
MNVVYYKMVEKAKKTAKEELKRIERDLKPINLKLKGKEELQKLIDKLSKTLLFANHTTTIL